MSETYDQNGERYSCLLDVSLFILDLLDPERLENQRGSPLPLEVPSALVTMIWAARDGSTVLRDLILAYLVDLQRNAVHLRSADRRIQRFVGIEKEKLDNIAEQIVGTLIRTYAPLIQGATRSRNGSPGSTTAPGASAMSRGQRPIQRYELVRPVPPKQFRKIRRAYKRELELPAHPLYDAYFLQIDHATCQGFAASPAVKRRLIALGRTTYQIIRRWTPKPRLSSEVYSESERYKRTLRGFIRKFVRAPWKRAAYDLGMDMTTAYVVTLESKCVPALTNVVGTTELHTNIGTLPLPPREGALHAVMGFFLLTTIILLAARPPWLFVPKAENATQRTTNTPTQLASFTPFTVDLPPYEETPAAESTSTDQAAAAQSTPPQPPPPANTPPPLDPNVCLYVVQPGDTLASIAARFQIPVESLYTANELLGRGVFRVRQRLRVDAPCCRPVGDAGTAYYVMPRETLYSIARRHSTTVDAVARANNLADPSYIQAHQMLCIPTN